MKKVMRATLSSRNVPEESASTDYGAILSDMKRLITESRYRAAATVNRELVCLYWQIGRVIVQQQETANWGDAVVEQLSADLRIAFPDMKGLMTANLWRMRQFFLAYREMDQWLTANCSLATSSWADLATVRREMVARQSDETILAAPWRELATPQLPQLIAAVSWSHHRLIFGAIERPHERYFYLAMAVRERWSEREPVLCRGPQRTGASAAREPVDRPHPVPRRQSSAGEARALGGGEEDRDRDLSNRAAG